MLENLPRFRLSVWQPAQSGRLLDYATNDGDAEESTRAFDHRRLQEEIYQWHPGPEDVWGCITDSEVSSRMRDLFVERFTPRLSPDKRSMVRFKDAVDDLGKELANDDASSWAD